MQTMGWESRCPEDTHRNLHHDAWSQKDDATAHSLTLAEGKFRPCRACSATPSSRTKHECPVFFQPCLMRVLVPPKVQQPSVARFLRCNDPDPATGGGRALSLQAGGGSTPQKSAKGPRLARDMARSKSTKPDKPETRHGADSPGAAGPDCKSKPESWHGCCLVRKTKGQQSYVLTPDVHVPGPRNCV